MKKIILVLAVMVALVGFASLDTGKASAARSQRVGVCNSGGDPNNFANPNNPDDTNFFPYGFLCGTYPGFNSGRLPNGTSVDIISLNATRNGSPVADNATVYSNSATFHITGQFEDYGDQVDGNYHAAKGKNGELSDAFVWLTIDTGQAGVSSTISGINVDGSGIVGNSTLACPGTGGVGPGAVYGYKDLRSSYGVNAPSYLGAGDINASPAPYDMAPSGSRVNGVNASPLAYNRSTGSGKVDCGPYGKMVYWKGAQTGGEFSFDITTPYGRGVNMKLRMNVSTEFSDDNGNYFPPGTASANPYEQHVVAAHLVKQSDELRLNVQPPSNGGGGTANSYNIDMDTTCTEVTGHIIRYNGSGQATNSSNGYFFQHWNPSTNRWDTIGSGNTNASNNSFSVPIDGAAYYGDGRDNAYQVINASTYGALPPAGSGGWIMGADKDCYDNPTVVQFTATCHSVTFTALSDGDVPGGGPLSVAINAYDRNTGSRAYTRFDNVVPGQTVEFSQPPNRMNDGVDIYAGAYMVHPYNTASTDYQAGTTPSGSEVYTIPSCYSATCSITTTAPGLPDGYVEEGKPFSIKATLYNTGGGDKNPLYSNLDGTPLTITPDFGNMRDNGLVGFNGPEWMYDNPFAGGQGVPIGGSQTRVVGNYTAPNRFGVLTLRGYADYYGRFAIGQSDTNRSVAPCEATNVRIMQHFHLYPHATVNGDSVEDPSAINYNSYLTLKNLSNPTSPSSPINGPGESSFYKRPVGSLAKQYKAGPVYPGGTYNDGDNTVMFSTSPYVPDDFEAGDKYCSDMGTDVINGFNDGFVGERGPDDIIGKTNVNPLDTNCLTVKNDATFKVLGNNVSAGGDFAAASGGACSGGGQLGGWFNNNNYASDGSGYTFGSGTQLSALALLKTTGVASARTSVGRSPTDLSFANSRPADKTFDNYSPSLGGNFALGSVGASHCLATVTAPTGTAALPTGNVSVLNGAFEATGNQTLSGGSLGPSQQVSIFVKGDVYIANNITYNTGGWDKDHIPSFILRTNGNIYIGPNVTQLDGLYVAQPRVDPLNPSQLLPGTASTIYTCGTGAYAPVTGGDVHDTCRNQLTVHGSFVADHVNLMRTYGTLRDEKPVGSIVGGTVELDRLKSNTSSFYILQAGNRSASGYTFDGVEGYILLPSASVPGTAPLYSVKHDGGDTLYTMSYGEATGAITNYGYKNPITIVGYMRTAPGPDYTPLYRWNRGPHYYTTDSADTGGSNEGIAGYVYKSAGAEASSVVSPTSPFTCSNAGFTSFNRLGAGSTCAAEVFDFSPEMYLSTYALEPPGAGALQFDAITSLPPVL